MCAKDFLVFVQEVAWRGGTSVRFGWENSLTLCNHLTMENDFVINCDLSSAPPGERRGMQLHVGEFNV